MLSGQDSGASAGLFLLAVLHGLRDKQKVDETIDLKGFEASLLSFDSVHQFVQTSQEKPPARLWPRQAESLFIRCAGLCYFPQPPAQICSR
jgi:hypothetical protein